MLCTVCVARGGEPWFLNHAVYMSRGEPGSNYIVPTYEKIQNGTNNFNHITFKKQNKKGYKQPNIHCVDHHHHNISRNLII